jgi:hypothetical protein
VVSLTAKFGWTFSGVAANSFTHSGATSVTNAANSGTVTITFPATAGADDSDPNAVIPIGNPSIKLYLNGSATPLAHNGTTTIGVGTGIFTVGIDDGIFYTDSIVWYLNGIPQPRVQKESSITLAGRTAGIYLVTVEARPYWGNKNSGAHTFVVQ